LKCHCLASFGIECRLASPPPMITVLGPLRRASAFD
jgi:hypothetical protein